MPPSFPQTEISPLTTKDTYKKIKSVETGTKSKNKEKQWSHLKLYATAK